MYVLPFIPGLDIRTSPLAPASEFLKKGLSDKYILVCTCLNGQVDFLSTTHFLYRKMAQILRNILTMQQNLNENYGFIIIYP